MANISQATEQDFSDLCSAANTAKEQGNLALAQRLDKMARQANASCTNQKFAGVRPSFCEKLTWQKVESCLI